MPVAHRWRKVKTCRAFKNQGLANWDLVPGLGCFGDILSSKVGKILLTETTAPSKLLHLGPERFRAFCAKRGVMMDRAKTTQISHAARQALALPDVRAKALLEVLQADARLMRELDSTIAARC